MTVDISKIKVGDTLVLEAKVLEVDIGSELELKLQFGYNVEWMANEGIIEHKPKPVEFKVGDIVYRNPITKDAKYEIIALYKDIAWCKSINNSILSNLLICYLEHVNED